jgi:hypothetical protein
MENVIKCDIVTGATIDLMKEAFDLWNVGGELFGTRIKKIIVSVILFDATHLLIFYY